MSRATKFVTPLSDADVQFLEETWRQHPTYTVRCRAHAILLSNQGYSVTELRAIFGISKPTALAWINRWEDAGREGLEDEPRPGGPPILTQEEQDKVLKPLLEQFPRRPKKVLQELKERTGKVISRATLRRLARKLGFRWKRFRRWQRKQRNEAEFRAALEEIQELRSSPDLQLAYFDEAGFSLQGVVPYGWQQIGTRRVVPVGAERGSIQVLGVQEEDGECYGYLHKGRVNGGVVADVLEDYSQSITYPTLLILDNASVHTCRVVEEHLDAWNDRGLYLYFLPTYSPELNAIERLWKKLKYQELPTTCWEHLSSLVDGIVDVFRNYGHVFFMPSLQG